MGISLSKISIQKSALIAGFGLLIMAIAAIFAEFTRTSLIVLGDVNATYSTIAAKIALYNLGIIAYLIVIMLDVVVAWALYIFLKPVNKRLSLIAGWVRVIYAVFFAISWIKLINVIGALKSSNPNQVMFFLDGFSKGWNFALAIFGIHLALVGYLVFKSSYIPKWLGILLVIAGAGYFTDSLGKILIAGYNLKLAMFTFIGELLFAFWLLIKGVKVNLKTD